MSWNDLVSNPQGLRVIFQGDPPPLVGVSLHEVSVDRDGPSLRLRFDLPGYPSDPPAKWHRLGFNTVQVELLFGRVTELFLTGISTEVIADISIRRNSEVSVDGASLELVSPPMQISAVAASLTVSRMSAYLNAG